MWLVGGASAAAIGSQTANTLTGVGSFSSIAWTAAEPVSHDAHADEKKTISRGRSIAALNVSLTDGRVARARGGSDRGVPLVLHPPSASTTSAATNLEVLVCSSIVRSLP